MLQERDQNQLDYKLCSVSIIMHTFFSILENFWLVWVPLLKILCVHIGTRLYRQGMLYCLYCHGPMKSYLVWLCITRGRIMSGRLIVNAIYGQILHFLCVDLQDRNFRSIYLRWVLHIIHWKFDIENFGYLIHLIEGHLFLKKLCFI